MAYQTKEKLETQNPTSLKQICDTIGDLKPRHIQKVASLIGTHWQDLGVKLNIPYHELQTLATPLTGGPTQYAAEMFNTWHRRNGHLSIAEVQKEVVTALEEAGRNDVADEVRNKPLHTVNDIQQVFQQISRQLVDHWKDVGLCLNLNFDTLATCKASAGPEDDPGRKMLQMWQQRTPPAEHTTQLITALHELGLPDIINAIKKINIGARQQNPIQENSLFSQESQTAQTGATAANALFEQSAGQSEDQHDANGPPGQGTVSEGGHQQAEGQAKYKNTTVPPRDAAPDPPSTVLDMDTPSSLPANKDVTTSDPPHASAKLNPGYEWMGLELKRLRDAVPIKINRPVVIALLDSGINTSHPDLQGYILESKKFTPGDVEEQDRIKDAYNHGTMSAGILWQYAGTKNVKLINLKVLTSKNEGSLRYVASALQYIKQWDVENSTMPVDIVVMSLGERFAHNDTDDLLNELGKKVLICSAGNEGERRADALLSPAKHGGVIAVGSCAEFGNRDDHSAVGPKLTFLFPGKNIKSTSSHYTPSDENTRYYTNSGTSFAAPSCAALVALLLPFIEQKLNNFCGKSGGYWRTEFTRCSRMEDLISNFCQGTYNVNKGYGVPNFKLITEYSIKEFIKQTFKT